MSDFQYTFRGADMADLPVSARDYIENRDEELELYLRNLPTGGSSPTGSLIAFAGSSAPSGWLICNGASLSTTVYAALFAVIGYTYGGSGSSFFVPNLKGRVPVGRDTAQSEFDNLGETGGAKTHTLTTSEMPSHNHSGVTDVQGSHSHTYSDFPNSNQDLAQGTYTFRRAPQTSNTGAAGDHAHNLSIYNTGGGGSHNNLQPYLVINWIIKT